MRLPILIIITLLAAAPLLRAQVPYDHSRNQSIAGGAGFASASGVSYQEILPSAFGYRATLFGWNVGGSTFMNAGLSGLRVLGDDGRRRVYLIAGASYWRWSDKETVTEFDDNDNVLGERRLDDIRDSWSSGVGAGIEVPFSNHSVIALEGLFTYWGRTGDFLPLPQVALHYQF